VKRKLEKTMGKREEEDNTLIIFISAGLTHFSCLGTQKTGFCADEQGKKYC